MTEHPNVPMLALDTIWIQVAVARRDTERFLAAERMARVVGSRQTLTRDRQDAGVGPDMAA